MKIVSYDKTNPKAILSRERENFDIEATVRDIISDVRNRKDEALREYTLKFDHANIPNPAVDKSEIEEALEKVDADFLNVLKKAAKNIREFHEKQCDSGYVMTKRFGAIMGQMTIPLDRVGIYVPGGTASYPSTVLMNAIPAKLANVGEIIMVTPPARDGKIAKEILAAAHLAGVDKIYKAGGAQAVAALAYGTQSIPIVDKIVGPGNAFVAEAKKQVFGQVDIDMIAGPSEILIIADDSANPRFLAADLLSQAEHDAMASAILVTTSATLAEEVGEEVKRQLLNLPRMEIARKSMENHGKIVLVEHISDAVDISNAIAPEHLELCVREPFDLLAGVRHAGSVFLGHYTPESLGDYLSGANHTLPTLGTARFASPLGVEDFVKKMQYTYYTREALLDVADDIALFALREGLQAHARSALIRKEELREYEKGASAPEEGLREYEKGASAPIKEDGSDAE